MGGVPQQNRISMTTLKKITEHTGLDSERIKELISQHDLNLSELSVDQARLEIIGILRAGASGTTKREDIEKEHARLLQAKRLKVTEQIKVMNSDMGKSNIVLDGYLIEDMNDGDLKKADLESKKMINALFKMTGKNKQEEKSDDEDQTPDDEVNYYPCSVEGCSRINLSDSDYIKYISGHLDISKIKTGGENANAN